MFATSTNNRQLLCVVLAAKQANEVHVSKLKTTSLLKTITINWQIYVCKMRQLPDKIKSLPWKWTVHWKRFEASTNCSFWKEFDCYEEKRNEIESKQFCVILIWNSKETDMVNDTIAQNLSKVDRVKFLWIP